MVVGILVVVVVVVVVVVLDAHFVVVGSWVVVVDGSAARVVVGWGGRPPCVGGGTGEELYPQLFCCDCGCEISGNRTEFPVPTATKLINVINVINMR